MSDTMFVKMREHIREKLSVFLEALPRTSFSEEQNSLQWRERIMFAIYLIGLLGGSASLVSSSQLAIQNGYWQLVVIYLTVYAWAIVITFARRMNFYVRAWSGLFLFYVLGLAALFTGGPGGSARLWLFGLSIVACLLLGLRAAVLTLVLNALALILSGWLMKIGILEWPLITPSFRIWAVGSITFIFLSGVVTISLAVLVRFLEDSLAKSQKLTAELASANEELQKEIANRKRTEEILRLSEQRYHGILNSCNDSILVFDADSSVLFANDAWFQNTEYNADDITAVKPLTIVHPDDSENVESWMNRLLTGEPIRRLQYRRVKKDGDVRWVESNADPISWRDISTAFVSVTRDITEQRRAEETLRESEERWRCLVENAPDIILTIDRNGKILFINHTVTGFAVDDVIGTNLLDYILQEHHTMVKERIERVFQTGNSDVYEIFGRGPNNTVSWYSTHLGPIKKEGSVESVILIVRDITDQKRAEEALKQSEAKYRALFDESKDVVYVTTPEGQVLDINLAGVELFGYSSKEEHLSINIPEDAYVHPESREVFQREIAEKGYVKDYELELKKKDGEKLQVLVSTNAVLDNNGNIVEYQGIMHDVTERRQMEFQLQQSSKLAALGELAAGVAHEINNPLAAIDIQAGLMHDVLENRKRLTEPTTQDGLKESLSVIEDQVRRCKSITENLLSFVQKPPDRTETFDINGLLKSTLRFVLGLVDKKIDVELILDNDLPLFKGDPQLLQQVFINLINNALKAITRGGDVTIASSFDDKKNIVLEFRDSGHGIAAKVKNRIFEPFFTTRPPGEGTGLGLSMSYHIIRQMGGTIEFDSDLGLGTTFTIMLPADDKREEEAMTS